MTYAEQLKDPRWQRMRLEIMERDGWACRRCASTTKTLNVHHIAYFPHVEPWNYPPHMLITLCEEDHLDEEQGKSISDARLIEVLRGCGAMTTDIDRIAQVIREMGSGPIALAMIQEAMDAMWTEARK